MKQDVALLEFQWPLLRINGKARVGRPTRQIQWDEALLAATRGSGAARRSQKPPTLVEQGRADSEIGSVMNSRVASQGI